MESGGDADDEGITCSYGIKRRMRVHKRDEHTVVTNGARMR